MFSKLTTLIPSVVTHFVSLVRLAPSTGSEDGSSLARGHDSGSATANPTDSAKPTGGNNPRFVHICLFGRINLNVYYC